MTTAAWTERLELCDLFDQVGPDAPTLNEGWDCRDLAAHIVIRENRPDSALGILAGNVAAFAAHTQKVQDGVAARPFSDIVNQIRKGPPKWSPARIEGVDRVMNTVEFFVHHEDVRRAADGWTVRDLPADLDKDLWTAFGRMGKGLVKGAPAGITFAVDGHDPIVAKQGEAMVTVSGPLGELVLWAFGRQAHSNAELDGPADAVAALQAASFGI